MKELFLPYYVNTGRLLDIYSILNHGYSEYEELALSSNKGENSRTAGEASINTGFKIFKLGGSLSGSLSKSKEKKEEDETRITEKKVQTISSILKQVLKEMEQKKYLKPLNEASIGEFVELDSVIFQINSIKHLMDEIDEIMQLVDLVSSISTDETNQNIKQSHNRNRPQKTKKEETDFNKISKLLRSLCNGEEVLYEDDKYAIVGNIYSEYLYQAIKPDIINTNLRCLCQLKRKHDNGASLMRNTILSKIKDANIKEILISSMSDISKNEVYDFESIAVSEIVEKPVYEIEIIALYK